MRRGLATTVATRTYHDAGKADLECAEALRQRLVPPQEGAGQHVNDARIEGQVETRQSDTHAHTHTRTRMYTHTGARTRLPYTYVHTHTRTHAHTHALTQRERETDTHTHAMHIQLRPVVWGVNIMQYVYSSVIRYNPYQPIKHVAAEGGISRLKRGRTMPASSSMYATPYLRTWQEDQCEHQWVRMAGEDHTETTHHG